MGLLDVLLGRTLPVPPNLDLLFAVPAAATTLQADMGLTATGTGAVCCQTAEGPAAARARDEALALLRTDPASGIEVCTDGYGYTWITCRRADGDLAALVTDLHAVNTALTEAGFGSSLLCTVVGFGAPRLLLVYLFKRGTFYPFAPRAGHDRDTALELQARARLAGELPIEPDLGRWFPIWDSPVT